MAILKDFIDQVQFPEVWAMLSAGSEDISAYESSCGEIFRELREAVPQENKRHMTIRFVEEEPFWTFSFDEEEDAGESAATLQVYGFVPGEEEGYAIGLQPTGVLVGLDVDPETARDFSPVEIVAHCMAEMIYTATMASSAFGVEKDTAGGGLLASQVCMSEDIQNVDLEALRQELGVLPQKEDYKSKYGFLF